MTALYTVKGSVLSIGGPVAIPKFKITATDFTPSPSWTAIGGWSQMGALAPTQQVASGTDIPSGGTLKAKGARDSGRMENTFFPNPADPGQMLIAQAEEDCRPWAFKVDLSANCALSAAVAISNGASATVTWNAHGLTAGQGVVFSTTGALPTGLTAGTTYFVRSAGLTANEFTVAATPGGAAIATSTAGTGTHTATVQPIGKTRLFYALVMPGATQGGDANALQTELWALEITSNILKI